MPRKDFKAWDLQVAGAIDIGRPVKEPDLMGDVHELFENWRDMGRDELPLLLPSMRLASNLIRVGMPYISSFLPAAKKDFWRDDRRDPWPSKIPLNPNPTRKEIREAEEDLKILARDLTWHANDVMYPKWGHMGVTRLPDTGEPWEQMGFDEVVESDKRLKSQGKKRRPLFIGIMKEYVAALEKSAADSESNIRATFMAAITMVHEVGHAIFQNDFRAFNVNREPYIGDDCEAEIGFSFIAWIFSGFHPQNSPRDVQFTSTLYWEPQYTLSMGTRPLYKTYYSIPIAYLERLLSQDFWDSLGSVEQPEFSERARKALRPDTDEQSPRVATGTKPNWKWSQLHDRPVWNEYNNFRMRGFKGKARVTGLTQEEIQHEYDLTKDDPLSCKYRNLTKERRRDLYRNMRMSNKNSDSSYEDDTDTGVDDESDEIRPVTGPNRPVLQPPQAFQKPKVIHIKDDEDEDDDLLPAKRHGLQKRTIEQMSRELLIRGAEINGLVTGPPSDTRKRPRLGSSIMEDIDDYEAVIDLTKETEDEKGGVATHGMPRGVKRRRVGTAQAQPPPTPPSHMKDIYDLIIISDDSDEGARADDEEEDGR